jgi:hypothetical protein
LACVDRSPPFFIETNLSPTTPYVFRWHLQTRLLFDSPPSFADDWVISRSLRAKTEEVLQLGSPS